MVTNLPVSMTGFVGRHRELAEVGGLSRGVRVVTICGTGGCGKTRLAVEVAREQLREHADGTWFVDLAALTSTGLVASAIATATGWPEAMPDAVRLVQRLSGQSMLLVLDNCEHLVEEAAAVVHAIARDCAQLRVLTTSREPLGIEGEWVYRLDGLPEPDAIRLFTDRARQADATFQPDDASAAICRRLDGLPLALELAAAHAGTMAPADILARLDRPLRLLVGGHSMVSRHRTIVAALAWSESMLTAAERTLYRRLGLFLGGFDLEAAEAVASGPDLPVADVVPLLRRLVERSLVQFERGHDHGRYRLLEPIREHALERLAEAGERSMVIGAYVRHYADVARSWRMRLLADSPAPLLTPNTDLVGNCMAAVEHAHAAGWADFARLVSMMIWVWQRTPAAEARRWLETALEDASVDLETRYWLLFTLQMVVWPQGDTGAGSRYMQEALAICEARGDTLEMARTLANAAVLERMRGDVEAGLACAQRAVTLARETQVTGRRRVHALALNNLALALLDVADLDGAEDAAEESVLVADSIGEPMIRHMCLVGRAQVQRRRGDLDRALGSLRLALALQPLSVPHRCGALATLAAVLVTAGRPERGLKLLGGVEAACDRYGFDADRLAAGFGVPLGDVVDQAMCAVGRRGAALRAAGREMALERAVDFALEDPQASASGVRLTGREAEVARLVRQGLTDSQIARRLVISRRTAEGHVESLRNKLGVGSRAEVAAWVVEHLPDPVG